MFTQREEGEIPKEVKDLERGPWDLGLCSPTPSGLVNLCEETSEVIQALPSHKLPNQCQLSEPLCSAVSSQGKAFNHFLRGFSGQPYSGQASLLLQIFSISWEGVRKAHTCGLSSKGNQRVSLKAPRAGRVLFPQLVLNHLLAQGRTFQGQKTD